MLISVERNLERRIFLPLLANSRRSYKLDGYIISRQNCRQKDCILSLQIKQIERCIREVKACPDMGKISISVEMVVMKVVI